MTTSRTWFAIFALAMAGVLFVLYPAVRPWQDESTVAGAVKAMSSGAWVAAVLRVAVDQIEDLGQQRHARCRAWPLAGELRTCGTA